MYEEFFIERLVALRRQKNVSAREMSLAIGQNESYINRIENGKTFPSMQVFFYICEYLNTTPKDFFDGENPSPEKREEILQSLNKFNTEQLDAILTLLKKVN